MKRALFICNANRLRSPTARDIFSKWPNVEADAAGLALDAVVTLSPDQLAWADIIIVMEKSHRNKLSKKFKPHLAGKRVVCLNIPDDYEYMDPVLIRLLETRAGPYLR